MRGVSNEGQQGLPELCVCGVGGSTRVERGCWAAKFGGQAGGRAAGLVCKGASIQGCETDYNELQKEAETDSKRTSLVDILLVREAA